MNCNDKKMTGQLAVRDGALKARVHPMMSKVCLGLLAGFWLASAQAQIDYTPLTLDDPIPQAGARFSGSGAPVFVLSSSAVAGVGDVNGDGIPDQLVGAPDQDVNGILEQGQAFVLSGADGSLLHTLDNPTPQTDSGFGLAVAGAGAGDVNGDHIPDLLVGARSQDVNGNDGEIFQLFRSLCRHLESLIITMPTIQTQEIDLRGPLSVLRESQSLLSKPELNILFLGTFKSGKSTLINSLIGENLLPVRATHATGVITRLIYADQRYASVIRLLPSGESQEEIISIENIASYILLTNHECRTMPSQSVQEVRIGLSCSLLNDKCMLIDSPGLFDEEDISRITFNELMRADLAIMLLPAHKLISEKERECIATANRLLAGNVVFVITQLDRIDLNEIEEVLTWAWTAIKGTGNTLLGGARLFLSDLYLEPQSPHRKLITATANKYSNTKVGINDLHDWLKNHVLSTNRYLWRPANINHRTCKQPFFRPGLTANSRCVRPELNENRPALFANSLQTSLKTRFSCK